MLMFVALMCAAVFAGFLFSYEAPWRLLTISALGGVAGWFVAGIPSLVLAPADGAATGCAVARPAAVPAITLMRHILLAATAAALLATATPAFAFDAVVTA